MMDQNKHLPRADETLGSDPAPSDNPMRALATAAAVDATVWRAFWRTMNLLEPPSTLMQPEFLAGVAAAASRAAASGEARLEHDSDGPTRSEMCALLGL